MSCFAKELTFYSSQLDHLTSWFLCASITSTYSGQVLEPVEANFARQPIFAASYSSYETSDLEASELSLAIAFSSLLSCVRLHETVTLCL